MSMIFIVLGYGIPDDILQDKSYDHYLSMVFNSIFDASSKHTNRVILLCGGNTDMKKPYRRTESGEMLRFLKSFIRAKKLQDQTKSWRFLLENRSVSTLENLLFAREKIQEYRIAASENLQIFCEHTRKRKVSFFARAIWPRNKVKITSIDFETAPRRYMDPAVVRKKEAIDMRFGAVALKNPQAEKLHHRLMAEKFKNLRKLAPGQRDMYIQEWFGRAEEEFGKMQNSLKSKVKNLKFE